MFVVQVVRDLLFRLLLEGSDDENDGPEVGPPPGSPPTSAWCFSPAIRVTDTTILTSASQIRRPLVHDPAGAIDKHRIVLLPSLLVLQDKMAAVIRSPDEVERQDTS